MTSVFLDTHYLLALVNTSDAYHQQAQALRPRYQEGLVTTEFVLLEVLDALTIGGPAERCPGPRRISSVPPPASTPCLSPPHFSNVAWTSSPRALTSNGASPTAFPSSSCRNAGSWTLSPATTTSRRPASMPSSASRRNLFESPNARHRSYTRLLSRCLITPALPIPSNLRPRVAHSLTFALPPPPPPPLAGPITHLHNTI